MEFVYILRIIRLIAWITFGIVFFILWIAFALITALTVVGLPYSIDVLRNSTLFFTASSEDILNSTLVTDTSGAPIANKIWACTLGLILAVSYVVAGLYMFVTIIGIPDGAACFKLARYSLTPFGAYFD
jgi:uncharacterized membrane protein YccF (DUF307 family)